MFTVARIISVSLCVGAPLASSDAARADQTDHSELGSLEGPFFSGPEVTRACLECHPDAATEVMATTHWTWGCFPTLPAPDYSRAHLANNFCIALPANEPYCTRCHAGYGWADATFDFAERDQVDCLVCHDTTGTYRKLPAGAGHPAYEPTEIEGESWSPPELDEIAQSVGKPSRQSCGSCHLHSGCGDGVKYADLNDSLLEPSGTLDVHMSPAGPDLSCQSCHQSSKHRFAGRCYQPSSDAASTRCRRATCARCHGKLPHDDDKLNDHLDKVSCQACHVPRAARGKATLLSWDWSVAGRLTADGAPVVERDDEGNTTYASGKGALRWGRDFIPEYRWYDGSVKRHVLGDRVDEGGPVLIDEPQGSYGDPTARIWPMKIHRGRQPYDPEHQTLVAAQLLGPAGSDAYAHTFDWNRSIRAGMRAAGLPYGGTYRFVETAMFLPIAHTIAPKTQSVACEECHRPGDGRLAKLGGFYLPGRDRHWWLDVIGTLAAAAVLLGVGIHGGLRIATRRRRSPSGEETS